MAPIRESIRFAAHCNFVQTEDGPMPIEIALATLWERSTTVLTVQEDEDNKKRLSRVQLPTPDQPCRETVHGDSSGLELQQKDGL
ncbi:hypothetical protein CEXT_558531 [Caerostris extrusa]|uniref:Uncharacterized protein n=1 Tax=Caerostris extrusa TaxID=172846 RepID=A0AAV4P4K3_CAEEX|nr:hypothetical protein CEXT_558531 [Caerostris extrusa]